MTKNNINNEEKLNHYNQVFSDLRDYCSDDDKDDLFTNYGLHPNSNSSDKAKYQLCKDILHFKGKHKLSNEKISQFLNINEDKVIDIIYSHYDKFTYEELTKYAEKLAESVGAKFNIIHTNTFIMNNNY
ncbi:MAG: hypothetical protein AD073_000267 [Mycoplasmataceae bacterium]|nr:MAG: hypothetical protein AD073_000267 [Mycoplasmataceae bacterium]